MDVFFREENDRVYRIDERYGENEILIYDFSMNVGDSITYYSFFWQRFIIALSQ